MHLRHVLLLPLLVLLLACTKEVDPVSGEEQSFGYSWEQEIELGAQSDRQIVAQLGLYDAPDLTAYVERVGQEVLAQSDLRDADAPEQYRQTPFTFRVLDSPVVNAFALPGGYIYLTRGLLAHLDNEAQLAVVLGHEIAHVAGRHASRRALKAQWGQLGLLAGAIIGSQVLDDPDLARDLINIGGQAFQLLLLKYSRDDEREADDLGARYAAAEGYAIGEAGDFFRSLERISAEQDRLLPSWQSTHPDPGERAEWFWEVQGRFPGSQLNQQRFYEHLQGLVLGDDPRAGYVDDGRFIHPEMRFAFPVPRGWKVRNEAAAVTLTHPDRQAAMVFEFAPGDTPRAAAESFVRQSGVQVLGSGATRVNGLDAYAVSFRGQSQQGELAGLVQFVAHNGQVFSFTGHAPSQVYRRVAGVFEQTFNGFAPVTDPRYLNVEPARLALVSASRRGRFQDFLPGDLPPGMSARDLAILNQVELDTVIEPGTVLKLPR